MRRLMHRAAPRRLSLNSPRRPEESRLPLRIVITVDPIIPVPPKLYGGIERIVDFLVKELVNRGHEITLLASPESNTPAKLIPYGVPPHTGRKARLTELWQVGSTLRAMRKKIDVVHSFGRLAALLPVLPTKRLPKIQSYQREIPWRSIRMANKIAGRSVCFTGCSASLFAAAKQMGPSAGAWHAIFNGVDVSIYQLAPHVPPDAPLAFLGRLDRIKGAHNAIAIAKKANRKLIIAGNKATDSTTEPDYFEKEIAPHLGDQIQYIGPVDDAGKNRLLTQSAAFLMPIEWEEPFGIVMAEALACGNPIIGFARGSVPEVVIDDVNGKVVSTVDEAAAALPAVLKLDRGAIRKDCEVRFSHIAIVDQYERLYNEMLAATRLR